MIDFFLFYQNEKYFELMADVRECNFRTGRILGKHFPEALVHTVHRTRACSTRPMDSMDLCFRKTLPWNSTRAEVAFSNSCHSLRNISHIYKKRRKNLPNSCGLLFRNVIPAQ